MNAARKIGCILLLTAALTALLARHVAAQTRLSIVAGLAISEVAGDDWDENSFDDRKGFHIGVAAEVPLLGVFTLLPGATYLNRGFTSLDGAYDLKLSYLEVSAPLRLNVPVGPVTVGAFASPGISLAFGCAEKQEIEGGVSARDCDPSEFFFKGWDFTGIIGAGLSIPLSNEARLLLNGALNTSLTSIATGTPKADFRHRSILINAGVSFPLRNR
jgi:hypothetical protein